MRSLDRSVNIGCIAHGRWHVSLWGEAKFLNNVLAVGTSSGDNIATTLRKQGIKYTHHNDKVLVENPAEKIRTKQAVQVCRISTLCSVVFIRDVEEADKVEQGQGSRCTTGVASGKPPQEQGRSS
jgi:hypothetical protein